jgi:purine catabolism regulator
LIASQVIVDVRLYLVDPETGLSLFGDGERAWFAAALQASYAAHGNAIPGVLRLARPGAGGTVGAVAVAVPGDLLSQLLDRRIDPRAAESRIADIGLDLAASVVAALRAAAGGTGAELDRRLARARVPHLLLQLDRMLYVVLPANAVEAHLLAGPARPPQAPQALVARILGPMLRHDAEHGTEHVRTVRVMLRHDRSWQQSAAELHIHKQTLGYRIRKIEQLTGRGLARTEDLAEWWFALRARPADWPAAELSNSPAGACFSRAAPGRARRPSRPGTG